uniref:Ribosomal L1 domain-containing protein 1 n=1 Tax=Clastoptera arizonana TaxID=38151 RepID=A0A1B6DRV7_9HEMI
MSIIKKPVKKEKSAKAKREKNKVCNNKLRVNLKDANVNQLKKFKKTRHSLNKNFNIENVSSKEDTKVQEQPIEIKNEEPVSEKDLKKNKKNKIQGDQLNIQLDAITLVTKSFLDLFEAREKNKPKGLFGDDIQKVYLQVNTIKKPICPTRMLRFLLPHSIYNGLSDICLIVPDKKGCNRNIEKTEEYYTEKLEEYKITNINKVLSIKAISTEYSQFEMRRKLADQFDGFLADGRISHYLMKKLGRSFAYTAKSPIPIHLKGNNWKEVIKVGLHKTQMKITSTADSMSVIVGNTTQSPQELAENILAVCQGLTKTFPGFWRNIRSLFLRTVGVPSTPVYMSVASPNQVRPPRMKSLKAPRKESVSGELTTQFNATVDVKADGTITVHRQKLQDMKVNNDVDDDIIKEAMKHKKQSKTIRENESDEDDKITESAEKKLLQKLAGNNDSDDEDENMVENVKEDIKPSLRPKMVQNSKRNNMNKELDQPEKKPKIKEEKKAKTNWIKSSKKGKKPSKDQRKALIKVKKGGKKK